MLRFTVRRMQKIPFYPVNTANPQTYFDISIGGAPAGRVTMQLETET